MIHALIAVVLQLVIAAAFIVAGMVSGNDLTGSPWPWIVGGAAGSWMFVGREIAQAEYRWIEAYGGGKRANMPSLTVYTDPRAWTRKGLLDFTLPTIACTIVTLVAASI